MTSGLSEAGTRTHRFAALFAALEAAANEAGGANTWTMSDEELRASLTRSTRVISMLTEIQVRMLAEADARSIGSENGAANTPMWWASATRQTKPAAAGAVRLGQDLAAHDTTRAALACGAVLPDQARVILDAVAALPTELVDQAIVVSAEKHLVGLAAHHDARALRILGRKILEVVAPDVVEEHERRILESEEQHAAATASFTMRPDGCGSMLGRFKVPTLAGEILAKHLAAIAAPKHVRAREASGTHLGGPVARPLRLGAAFVEYLETRAAAGTPKAGGIAATVVVTMTMADLLGGGGPATLDTSETISAAEARRLACEAGIIPAVLGSKSQVLDLGRRTRFHTEPQRTALMLRDRGCAAEHCDWPPGMCHAHHPTPWSEGGRTSVKNGMLLCPRHHSLAHDARYQLKSGKNGKVAFSRRT